MKTRPRPHTVRLAALITVLFALALPGIVLASDRYADVPSEHVFHDDAAALAEAGITTGCLDDPPRYCPGSPVSRGQMAGFLNRGLPRAGFGTSVALLDSVTGHSGVAASAVVDAGAATGGHGYVVLNGSVTVYASSNLSACPCEVEAFIHRSGSDEKGPSSWSQIPGEPANTGTANASLSVTWVTPVATGTSETFSIAVFINGTAPSEARAEGALSAIYVPFGSEGEMTIDRFHSRDSS